MQQQTGSAAPRQQDGTQERPNASVASQNAARHRRERGQLLQSFAGELDGISLELQADGISADQAEFRVTSYVRSLLGIPEEGTWVDAADLRLRFNRSVGDFTTTQRITQMLHNDGVRTHLSGFNALREAVQLVAADPSLMHKVMQVYSLLAERQGTTPSRVERSIRHALSRVKVRGTRPASGEYIALLADRVREGY